MWSDYTARQILLSESSKLWPSSLFYEATIPILAEGQGGSVAGKGSGFVLAHGWDRDTPGDEVGDPFLIVSARHVVQPAINRGFKLFTTLRSVSSSLTPELLRVDLPAEQWHHDGTADISIVRLDVDAILQPVRLAAIPRGYLFHKREYAFQYRLLTCDVRPIGLWREELERSVVLMRRGVLASPDVVEVSLEVGHNVFAKNKVFLVDASVTPSMSGGPVLISISEGTAQNALLGVIHGYWFLGKKLSKPQIESQPQDVQGILKAMPLVNGNLVYVVTSQELERVANDALSVVN